MQYDVVIGLEIHAELNILQNESNSLMEQINANLKELGLGEQFMATKNSIKLFQDKIVRSIWDDEKEEVYYKFTYKSTLI